MVVPALVWSVLLRQQGDNTPCVPGLRRGRDPLTSQDRASHCHAMSTLTATDCDHSDCTEVNRRFSDNLVAVTMAFANGEPLPEPLRRLGNVSRFAAEGKFALNNLDATLSVTIDRLNIIFYFGIAATFGVPPEYSITTPGTSD